MYDLAQLLVQVFGPAAVTLLLLIVAIARLWPVVLDTFTGTRESNKRLMELIQEITVSHSKSMGNLLQVISEMDTRSSNNQLLIVRELQELREAMEGIDRRSKQRDEEIIRLVEHLTRRINGT